MPPHTFSVLLVQPGEDERDMYTAYLRHHGIDVLSCSDAGTALQLADSADVVVTGLALRGSVDGLELVTRLRSNEPTRLKPIVVLTTRVFAPNQQRAKEAGCDVFLSKPCLPRTLLDEIRRAVRRVKARPAQAKLDTHERRKRSA